MKKISINFLTLLVSVFLLSFGNITAQTPSSISGPTNVACNANAAFFFNPGTIREITPTGPGDPNPGPIDTIPCEPIANWTVRLPNGIIRSFSGTSILVNLGSTPGIANISATTVCGNMGQSSSTSRSVVVGGVRLPTPSLAGVSFLCSNSSGTYTISAVSGASSYRVEVPTGWRVNNTTNAITTTSRTITLRAPSTGAGAGQIRVRANANSTCDINSNFSTKTISFGRRNIEIFGPTSTAPNNLIVYNCSTLGISNFNWTVPSSWNLHSGTNQAGIVVESPSSSGTYTIRVTGTSCGVTVSRSINVTVATGGSGGGPIPIGGGGMLGMAEEESDIEDTNAEENSVELSGFNTDNISMYPNPVKDVLHFRSSKNQEISSVELFDLQGKKVASQVIDLDGSAMDVKRLNIGLYMARIVLKDGSSIVKKVQVNK
ncbi:T9SS type A sorting domain-containing protein [uncultured Aquimarina sp.]|uniref:T9SS type A sorting domain-containing protein n=1 Tax=uncultured Aquimarina sp. TaxID=575652 RepID=UPI002617FEB2|nr:T9SS type A sorting domain-containing protein [uncultured Aquimarina sp.]